MRSAFLFFFFLQSCLACFAQAEYKSYSTAHSKKAIPVTLEYEGGVHLLFVDKKEIRWQRFNHDLQIERKARIDKSAFKKLEHIFAITGDRKTLHFYFTKRNDKKLHHLAYNTINTELGEETELKTQEYLHENQLLHFSRNDSLFRFYLKDKQVHFSVISETKSSDFICPISTSTLQYWRRFISKYPQLNRVVVDERAPSLLPKNLPSPIKVFLQEGQFRVLIEEKFKTTVLSHKGSEPSLTLRTYAMPIENAGALGNSLSGSYLLDGKLFQAFSSNLGVGLKATDLESDSVIFSNFKRFSELGKLPSNYWKENPDGSLRDAQELEKQPDNYDFLSLNVYKKGPYFHSYVTYSKPTYDWLKQSTRMSTGNYFQKIDGRPIHYLANAHGNSQTLFANQVQQRSECLAFSVTEDGEFLSFLGEDVFPLRWCNMLPIRMLTKGMVALHQSMMYVGDQWYYNFYVRSKKGYYFVEL